MTDHIEDSPIKMKNRGGQPPNSIWEDINKGEAVGSGKFAASCKYCKNTWSRGEVSKLEEHLSNHCPDAPAAVVRRYMTKVMERQDKSKSSKKRKYSEGQSNMDDYHDSTELNEQRCTRINRALVKFFIACGIAFRVVEHPFFINFIKELNAGEIGDILRDILDDSDENNAEDDEVDDSGNNKRPGEGDYDYDIDDVLGMDDGDNNDDNYDDNEE
ncbi:hypothetical protein RhiirA1_436091 [Rhizophagus irregularis]|uniref:BED-type domain-containing protein n=1 Tax=Rhizophagus irregularis TaxID=588596 RepID=A0A2N0SJ95_9GLOM|nr:hypothetical protein RhiirA1_436091 [Rhizophagus irregularis]